VANFHEFGKHSFRYPEQTFQTSVDPASHVANWPQTNQVSQEMFGSETGIGFFRKTTPAD